ncbi:MAG: diacylglycerol kinase family protein [Sphingomonadales bacterium]
MTQPPRTATLIVNTLSRKGSDMFDQACQLLIAGGVTLDAHPLDDPKELTSTVEKAVSDGAEMIIVGGGDGSLSSSVDFLAGTDVVFALLPLGTANSFARSVGIPLDLEGAVDVIVNGNVRKVDLGMIDDDYYANCAAIGLAPLIAETVPHWLKRWFGRLGYLTWAAVSLVRFKPFILYVDGEKIRALEVRIANGAYQGGTEVVDDADVMSGEIVVQAVLGTTRRALLWSWLASTLRLPHRKQTTREFRGTSIRVETVPRLPISIDGEIAARTPVTAHVASRTMKMVVPRQSVTLAQ